MPSAFSPEEKAWISTQTGKPAPHFLVQPDLAPVWEFLKKSEELYKVHAAPAEHQDDAGNPEFGLTLYAMHHYVDAKSTERFKELGLPPTLLASPEQPAAPALLGIDVVGKDGSLNLEMPFGGLDPGWALAGISQLMRKAGLLHNASFGVNPPDLTVFPDKQEINIVVVGDWGTGAWLDGACKSPAELVAAAITNMNPAPDILIHLGDVYYAGRPKEETDRLLPGLPHLPSGYHFTLNSNHEMYSGGGGFFETALQDPLFSHQSGNSCFALRFGPWVIVGLDSAFFDDSIMVSKGKLNADGDTTQKAFIQGLHLSATDRVIAMTHHPGVDLAGENLTDLYGELTDCLGRQPEYWYYGHIHAGVVYDQPPAIGNNQFKTITGKVPALRCVGHSAIPFGPATLTTGPGIPYYACTPYPATPAPKGSPHRVLNGFAKLTLSHTGISEQMLEVFPDGTVKVGWSRSSPL